MDKFIEILKGFVVDEDEDDFTDEEIAKAGALGKEPKATLENALNTFAEYKESMPDDLLAAAKIVVREAALGHPVAKEDLEKAGAQLSKNTKAQITKALELLKGSPAAIAVLKTMLGQKVEKVDETGSGDGDEEVLSAETQAKLEKLEGLEKADKERIEKEVKEAEKEAKEKAKETEDRLEALEKEHGIKQSLDEEDEDDDDDDNKKKKKLKKDDKDKDNWPSLYVPGIARRG